MNTINLDDEDKIRTIDKSDVLSSIEALPDQCQQAWEEVKNLNIPEEYQQVKNIVVCGMGGSALGSHIFYSLYNQQLKIPFCIINDYHLPAFVNEETLILLSSYSGTTEETLNCGQEALFKKAKILGITTGSTLGEFLKKHHLPFYLINPKYNPCNQPRMGLGYSILGQIALFNNCNLITLSDSEVYEMIKYLRSQLDNIKEAAKLMVTGLIDKIPVILTSGFLVGNAHVLANQLNENAKNFSTYFALPELNHHLLEGFKNPKSINSLVLLFLNSSFFDEIIKKRINITKEIIAKYKLPILEFKPEGDNKLKQIFITLLFGSLVSFYLSIIYYQDPSLIPWVDYFKNQLKK